MPDAMPDASPDARRARPREPGERGKKRGEGEKEGRGRGGGGGSGEVEGGLGRQGMGDRTAAA